jgi:hypothetical protein
MLYAAEQFFVTTLHGPRRKHRLILSRFVLGQFTAPLISNGRGAEQIENNLSIVEEFLPRACVYRAVAYEWVYTSQYHCGAVTCCIFSVMHLLNYRISKLPVARTM